MFMLLMLVLRAALVLAVVSASLIVGAEVSGSRSFADPFAPYQAVMPGKSRADAVQQGFDCRNNGLPFQDEYCRLNPETGPFAEIRTVISPETGKIKWVVFELYENTLNIGTLMLLWGRPKSVANGKFRWYSPNIVATPHAHQHFSYQNSVDYVSFESAE